MKLNQTPIDGLMVVKTEPYNDQRGSFVRLYCQKELLEILGSRKIMQVNHSYTRDIGTVRGLHYQHAPHSEIKMVRCLKGKIWDVVVDLRSGSPTFLKWHAEELSPANNRMIVIPEGCAHGFQVLEADSELLYLHTANYSPSAEAGIRPTDPALSISWPLALQNLSNRDLNHPLLVPDFAGLTV